MRIISINYSLRRQNIFSLRLSNLSFSQWKWINIKMKWKIQETKLHTIQRFPAGSFAVHIGGHFRSGDHLLSKLGINSRLGIVCGRGSFAALYSTSWHWLICWSEQKHWGLVYTCKFENAALFLRLGQTVFWPCVIRAVCGNHFDSHVINSNPQGCSQALLPPVIVSFSNFSGVVWTENSFVRFWSEKCDFKISNSLV